MFEVDSRSKASFWPSWGGAPRSEDWMVAIHKSELDAVKEMRLTENTK